MRSTHEALIRADGEHLVHPLHCRVDTPEPVIYVKGQGAMVEDIAGRTYIDGLSGLWNVNVGHGRAELALAAAAQMKELASFSCYVGSSNVPAIELAERLVCLAGGAMAAAFFTAGGAEANETAFKTARFHWKALGRPDKVKVIARHHGYHGLSLQAMSATEVGLAYWKMFEPRVPGFVHVPTCYPFRYQGARPGETVGQAAARELEEAIQREGADTVAAFIAEPIHGVGGVLYPTDDYWPLVRDVCTRHDVLLIADEIITGFCRTGRWFALQHWDVTPDMITFAKGVTSGYLPLGGVLFGRAIKQVLDAARPEDRWMHAFTYSGHAACCAVALANIDIMEREGLAERAAAMGERLHRGLLAAFRDSPQAGEVRGGRGLMAAVELVRDRNTKENFAAADRIAARLQAEMMKRGVITRVRAAAGAHPAPGDIVCLAPPLVTTASQIDTLVRVTRDAVDAVLGVPEPAAAAGRLA